MFGRGFFFVALCMTLIAASAGAVLYYAAGVTPVEAAFSALALLFGLLTVETVSARARDRREANERLETLSRAAADIATQVTDLHLRLEKIEYAPAPEAAEVKLHTEPLAQEISDLAGLVEDLAKTVNEHESLLAQKQIFAAPSSPAPVAAPLSRAASPDAALVANVPAAPVNPLGQLKDNEVAVLIRDALVNERLDVHLQPIVTLPQRKVRFYKAVSRLRLPEGSLIEAKHFIASARRSGIVMQLDENLVQASLQVVRKLSAKSRDIGIFFNIAPETLTDRASFNSVMNVLNANRAIAPSVFVEIAQSDFRSPDPVYRESLNELREHGFRLAIDQVSDLHIDPQAMAERGVRYLKVPADLLLGRVPQANAQVHPADLVDLLGRYGIDLIGEKIETEVAVADLLDFNLGFGQGSLFGPLRPIRSDVLKGEVAEFPAAEKKPAAAAPAMPRQNDLSKLASRTVRRA
ncbi:MAG: EAL domain-containing protein [Xanthobacteraceae bacterium]